MGAEQSSQNGAGQGRAGAAPEAIARKTCYYDVLGIERTAEHEDIRRAYKKKALELHPDRNFDDVENATKRFAEVQTAYEILSDPQERAWYDSHRDAVLRGDEDAHDGGPSGQTTTEDIMTLIGRFNSSIPFNDTPSGFFGILDITFGQLASQEDTACNWDGQVPVQYPPFGSANDDYDTVAKPFYNVWSNFSTKKTFAWKEKYRTSDAPDRRIRRLIDKENKKLRDDAIRDFNDAVRSLVAFVKKRDPRYVPNTQSEAERQKILRDSTAAQAARARAAYQEKLSASVVPDWAKSRGEEDHNDEFATSEEDSEVEHIECVVCNKTFKSEKQFDAHEKSKKHIKAVQQLRRELRKDDIALGLDGSAKSDKSPPAQAEPEIIATVAESSSTEKPANSKFVRPKNDKQDPVPEPQETDTPDNLSSSGFLDDEYAPRDAVEDRLASKIEPGSVSIEDDLASNLAEASINEWPGGKKMGKAKAKREKKAARQAAEAQAQHKCGVCQENFESRTKLFNHIKEKSHAELQTVPKNAKGGKKSQG